MPRKKAVEGEGVEEEVFEVVVSEEPVSLVVDNSALEVKSKAPVVAPRIEVVMDADLLAGWQKFGHTRPHGNVDSITVPEGVVSIWDSNRPCVLFVRALRPGGELRVPPIFATHPYLNENLRPVGQVGDFFVFSK